jgi:arylsulfatase A-like enzyme
MPELRRFAVGAWCFSRHYAASNFTTPTTSTLESGALPWTHLAAQPDAKMLAGTARGGLAAVLRGRGYRTVSLSDNLLASPRSRGTHADWDRADLVRTNLFGNTVREAMSVFPDTALPQIAASAWAFTGALDVWWHGERNPFVSARAYERASEVLAAQRADEPLFLWVHTLPPHAPYLPPPETKGRLLHRGELERWKDQVSDNLPYAAEQQPHIDKHRLRYRESMLAADMALGRFLDGLTQSGRLDRSIVVVTSDHGESFERGFIGHAGPHLHEALVRVPFVLRLPGQAQGRIVETPMSQADVASTLADLVGAPPPVSAEGRSWRPMLDGEPWDDTPLFAMSLEHQNRFKPITGGRFAVVDGRFKLWTTLGHEPSRLYDVLSDPAESRDLALQQPQRITRLEALVRERLARAESRRVERLATAP